MKCFKLGLSLFAIASVITVASSAQAAIRTLPGSACASMTSSYKNEGYLYQVTCPIMSGDEFDGNTIGLVQGSLLGGSACTASSSTWAAAAVQEWGGAATVQSGNSETIGAGTSAYPAVWPSTPMSSIVNAHYVVFTATCPFKVVQYYAYMY